MAVHTALTALRANASVEGGRTAVLLALAALGLHLTVRGARDAFAAPRVHRGVVEAFEVQSLPDQRGMSRAEVTLITGGRRWCVPGQAIDLDRGEPIEVTFTAGSKTLLTIRALGRDRPDPTA